MPSLISPTSSTDPGTRPSVSYREDRVQLPGQEQLEARPASPNKTAVSNTAIALDTDWNAPFNSETTLYDYIRQSPANLRAGVFEKVDARLNAFLNIPNFLYYPSDLAQNRRYHHFIVFNIYQGTSDHIRVKQRETNLTESALIASGGLQFGSFLDTTESNNADMVTLTQQSFSAEQIQQYFENKKKLAGGNFELGPVSDARYNSFDALVQGAVSNLVNQATSGRKITQDMLDGAWAGLKGVFESAKNDATDFVKSVIQREMVDMWANEKDTNERGINGQKLQKPRSERSILLANKRFTIANNKSKDTICLYMPQKIAINDQLVYQEEDMGMAKTLLAAVTGKRGAGSALVEKAGTNFVAGIINKATNIAGVEDFNLQAVRNAATRSVSNPRREVMFRDVGIRSHTFSFEFAPRNPAEAQTVLNIIKMLRFHAYPGLRGGGGHFFTFPAEFEVSFMAIDDSGVMRVNNNLPFLPRLALTTVSVDYSGAGDFKTFPDAIPAFIKVELGFQEMEQLTSEHVIHGF